MDVSVAVLAVTRLHYLIDIDERAAGLGVIQTHGVQTPCLFSLETHPKTQPITCLPLHPKTTSPKKTSPPSHTHIPARQPLCNGRYIPVPHLCYRRQLPGGQRVVPHVCVHSRRYQQRPRRVPRPCYTCLRVRKEVLLQSSLAINAISGLYYLPGRVPGLRYTCLRMRKEVLLGVSLAMNAKIALSALLHLLYVSLVDNSLARHTSRLSHIPLASLARVLASSGAITIISAQFRSCRMGEGLYVPVRISFT